MTDSTVSRHIERLQAWRVPGERFLRLSEAVGAMQHQAARFQRQLGSFADAWDQLVPDSIGRCAMVESKRGGTVHVVARSASVAFELDRRLRDGLLNELRVACSGSITNVRVRVGSIPAEGSQSR